jgi:16S rRNA G527 N7-methylase RsmG
MRKAIQELSLEHLATENDRLENIVEQHEGAGVCDGFTSRATLKLAPTLALAAHLVVPGGSAFLWKGSGHDREIAEDKGWSSFWELIGIQGVGSGPNVVARFKRLS